METIIQWLVFITAGYFLSGFLNDWLASLLPFDGSVTRVISVVVSAAAIYALAPVIKSVVVSPLTAILSGITS